MQGTPKPLILPPFPVDWSGLKAPSVRRTFILGPGNPSPCPALKQNSAHLVFSLLHPFPLLPSYHNERASNDTCHFLMWNQTNIEILKVRGLI